MFVFFWGTGWCRGGCFRGFGGGGDWHIFSFLYWKRSLAFGWLKLMSSTFWLCWVLVHMNCKVLSTDTRPWDCWCLLIVLFYGSSARPLKCFKFIFDAEVLVLLINDCWSVRFFYCLCWSTRLFRLLPAFLKCSSFW